MLLLHICVLLVQGFTPVGLWQTVDDKTHEPRGMVRLYEKDGVVFGRIEAIFDSKDAAERCTECRDERKNLPVKGLTIVRNMRRHGDEYSGGDILDPDTGSVYRCRMTLEDGGQRLVVRGFIGFSLLGRSQNWLRKE